MAKRKTYEEALSRLEEIAQLMEDGTMGLEESVKLYKEGVELSLFCSKKLNEAEQEVSLLQKTAEGEFESTSFKNTPFNGDLTEDLNGF